MLAEAGKSVSQKLFIFEGRERKRPVFRQQGMLSKNISSLSTEGECIVFQPEWFVSLETTGRLVPAATLAFPPPPQPYACLAWDHISNLRAEQRKAADMVGKAEPLKAWAWVLILLLTKYWVTYANVRLSLGPSIHPALGGGWDECQALLPL